MGNINISDLRPAGVDLFLDSESYINDLTEGEMINKIVGGYWTIVGGYWTPWRSVIQNIDVNIEEMNMNILGGEVIINIG